MNSGNKFIVSVPLFLFCSRATCQKDAILLEHIVPLGQGEAKADSMSFSNTHKAKHKAKVWQGMLHTILPGLSDL